jgi:trk system potassium uptake protein TrkH
MNFVGKFIARRSASTLFIGSFAIADLLGALLLMLPWSTHKGFLPFVDALFTATSAICVTGLTVVDTGSYFTLFGQLIVLGLVQLGGLGTMTLAALLFLTSGWGMSLRQRSFIYDNYTVDIGDDLRRLVPFIFATTGLIEIVGALVMLPAWHGPISLTRRLYVSVFHAVTAFCNAGFSLYSDNLMGYAASPTITLTIALLIILGGIGFPVLYELWHSFRTPGRHRYSLHAKLVLTTTAALLVLGTLLIWLCEQHRYLNGLGAGEQFLVSFFQAVTPRTAGFNTADINGLSTMSLVLIIILMFIGASPGSCGGGVKTSSFAALCVVAVNRVKGRKANNAFNANLSEETISRAITVFAFASLFVTMIVCLMLVATPLTPGQPEDRSLFLKYLFEAVSAFGTVGLSMNLTPTLNPACKYLITLTMFTGRIGILTLIYRIIDRRRKPAHFEYASENMLIG